MSNYTIIVCDKWNGKNKVCDSKRCEKEILSNEKCYHKPFVVNGEYKTVIETMEKLFLTK